MKYFKFAQISQETGISWAIEQPISGPSFPEIEGLNGAVIIQLRYNPIYYIAEVDDLAKANPENHIFEITLEEYAQELKDYVMDSLNEEKDSIYTREYEFRKKIFSKYHDTASIAGIYKYQQAKELIENNAAAASEVRAEATARGVDVITLAQRIIENQESFKAKETKIAGIRGKILDRLETFNFDLNEPKASYDEFFSTEVIGTRTGNMFDGELNGKEIEVKVRKYVLNIDTRFQYE